MRYLEYIWAGITVVLGLFLAISWQKADTKERAILLISLAIAAFMYSFRKKQRQLADQRQKEQQQNLEVKHNKGE